MSYYDLLRIPLPHAGEVALRTFPSVSRDG